MVIPTGSAAAAPQPHPSGNAETKRQPWSTGPMARNPPAAALLRAILRIRGISPCHACHIRHATGTHGRQCYHTRPPMASAAWRVKGTAGIRHMRRRPTRPSVSMAPATMAAVTMAAATMAPVTMMLMGTFPHLTTEPCGNRLGATTPGLPLTVVFPAWRSPIVTGSSPKGESSRGKTDHGNATDSPSRLTLRIAKDTSTSTDGNGDKQSDRQHRQRGHGGECGHRRDGIDLIQQHERPGSHQETHGNRHQRPPEFIHRTPVPFPLPMTPTLTASPDRPSPTVIPAIPARWTRNPRADAVAIRRWHQTRLRARRRTAMSWYRSINGKCAWDNSPTMANPQASITRCEAMFSR